MPKVVAQYAAKMSEERKQRIRSAIDQSGATSGKSMGSLTGGGRIIWSDVEWIPAEDDTETELIVHFNHVEPRHRVHDRDRAVRLAAELRCCGMVATVEEYDDVAVEM